MKGRVKMVPANIAAQLPGPLLLRLSLVSSKCIVKDVLDFHERSRRFFEYVASLLPNRRHTHNAH